MAIDKKTKDAIDNYSNQIDTLEDFQTAARTRTGMYLGPGGVDGFLNMCREIFQNAVDQMMMAESPADHFTFSYDENTHLVEVEDNGLGLPFNDIKRIIMEPHTSKNFEKKPYDYSSGLNGIGAKVTSAVSEIFIVESYKYDGTAVKMEFYKGYPKTDKPVKIKNPKKKQGTKISFIPDIEILHDLDLPWKTVYTLIKLIMCQTNIGDYMEFKAIDKKGKIFKEKIVNTDGIVTPLIMNIKRPIIKPIIISADDGSHKLNCAFCYDSGDETGPDPAEQIISFSNFCPTTKGTHVDGVVEGISRWFSKYMNTVYLVNQNSKKKNKLTVTFSDIKTGLNVMISAAHLEPEFTGQAKEILSNKDMIDFCKEIVMKGLDEWSKANPQDLTKLSKFFKEIAEIRTKSDKEKVKIANKFGSNPINGLPAKYKRPLGKKNIELIIVEGDSAMGTVVDGRDPQCQGALPIKGKIPNAFSHSREKFFSNEEVQSIFRIIFGPKGYNRHFVAPDDCLVDKVIIMADADVDGSHIAALVLRMFVMYMPQMIEAGMLYKAIPPLYSISSNRKKKYFTENIDIVKYIQKSFTEKYTMSTLKKVKLAPRELTTFFINNAEYIYYLQDLSDTYKVHRSMTEFIMYHYVQNGNKFNFAKLKKEAAKQFRFFTLEKIKNTIVFVATLDEKYTFFINDKTIYDARYLIDILHSNKQLYYLINGNKSTLFDIMDLYNKVTPNSIQRYKGLGEMDADELAESTLLPTGNRTLIRYTLNNAKEEIETIRQFESNPKMILGLVGNVSREDLLD